MASACSEYHLTLFPFRCVHCAAYFESGGTIEPALHKSAAAAAFTNGKRATGTTVWLSPMQRESEAAPARYRVVVFSWTGNRGGQGSAHNLRRAPFAWAKEFGSDAELYEVSYTGRGTRMKEPLRSEPHELIAEIADALRVALNDGLPYCLVGFAFGAVLAYEVGRAIAAASNGTQGPALVVAVSSEGPSWAGRAGSARTDGPLHSKDEATFREVRTKEPEP